MTEQSRHQNDGNAVNCNRLFPQAEHTALKSRHLPQGDEGWLLCAKVNEACRAHTLAHDWNDPDHASDASLSITMSRPAEGSTAGLDSTYTSLQG